MNRRKRAMTLGLLGLLGGSRFNLISRVAKTPGETSWVEVITMNHAVYGNVELMDVTSTGMLIFRGANYGFTSIDEGTTLEFIKYNGEVVYNFPATVATIRVMADGKLLVVCTDGKFYKSTTVAWNSFDLVLTMETAGAYTPNQYGLTHYDKYVFAGEYANPLGNNLYASQDYGSTWSKIFTLPTRDTSTYSHHIHNTFYDKYERKIWVVTGDTDNRNIYYSNNFGASWVWLGDFGTVTQNMIQIIPLPERIVFLSDGGAPTGWGIKRNTSGTYRVSDLEVVEVFNASVDGGPLGSRSSIIYGDDACSYLSFSYLADTQPAATSHLYATYDGLTYHDLGASANAPSGAGNVGTQIIVGPTADGTLYIAYNKGTAGMFLCKMDVPTWT